jgi:SAM-dependent methyltransferase
VSNLPSKGRPYSAGIYDSWRQAQEEKYADVLPFVEAQLRKARTLLDIGIGKAWLEGFLLGKGLKFEKVVGVDVDEEMVEPRLPGVEYVITGDYKPAERFDFVICFDALHLLKEPGRLLGYAKPGCWVLAAEPLKFAGTLKALGKPAEQGVIGSQEQDRFVLVMLPPSPDYRK